MGQAIARATNLFSSTISATNPIHTPIPTATLAEAEIHTGEDEDEAEEPGILFLPENAQVFASPLQKTLHGIHGIGHVEEE